MLYANLVQSTEYGTEVFASMNSMLERPKYVRTYIEIELYAKLWTLETTKI